MDIGTIGSRLREVRERLGKDQSEFAKDLGIPRNSLHRYETDDQVPGGGLFAHMAELGYDVLYILRGAEPLITAITNIEQELVCNYRLSHKDVKKGVEALLKATSDDQREKSVYNIQAAISEREAALVTNFRAADDDSKSALEKTVAGLVQNSVSGVMTGVMALGEAAMLGRRKRKKLS